MKRFFIPCKGSKYEEGICGKKILVVGASFYCSKKECKYFKKCTNPAIKDSSEFNLMCPFNSGQPLNDAPQLELGECYKSYVNFSKAIQPLIETCIEGKDNYDEIWDHLAFTNYVQFWLPTCKTKAEYLSERDFEAFIESVEELEPDIVILWGCVINDRLKQNNEYVIDKELLKSTDYYVCHMKLPSLDKTIALVNPYHPSSPCCWYPEKKHFVKYLKMVLEE